MRDARLERRLFLLLVALDALLYAFLILDRRLMRGHDTFLYYSIQYFFMCNAAAGDGPALWLPFMAQGTDSAWTFAWQGGLVQSLLLGAAPLLKGAGFLPVFYLGAFLDEMILVAGLWLLGRRLYSSPYTVFFVAAAAAGSCVWIDQAGFNFRVYFALPILIAWLHDILERGTRWKLWMAVTLVCLKSVANYAILLEAAVLAAYFILHFLLHPADGKTALAALRPRRADLLWGPALAVPAALAFLLYREVKRGLTVSPLRSADGGTPLDVFLTYGDGFNPVRYADFLFGVSPALDYTVFCGAFTTAFALLALFVRPDRRVLHLALCALLVLLFTTGPLNLVAMASYYLVPKMSLFRHVSYVPSILRLFVILLAGYGFEAVLLRAAAPPRAPLRWVGGGFLALSGTILLLIVTGGADTLRRLMLQIDPLAFAPALERTIAGDLAFAITGFSAGAAGILLLRPATPHRLALALALHAGGLFAWELCLHVPKTFRLDDEQAAMQRLDPIPYTPRRSLEYSANARYRAFQESPLYPYGTKHGLTDSFFFMDAPSPRHRTTTWQPPLDDLMRVLSGQKAGVRSTPLKAWSDRILTFPIETAIARRLCGLDADKLRVYGPAPAVGGEVSLEGTRTELDGAEVRVESYGANHLRARVKSPAPGTLSWSDVWHPGWRATVNGAPAAVHKADLAYKAVELPAGESVVEFRFRQPLREACIALMGLLTLPWLAFPFGVAAWIMRRKP